MWRWALAVLLIILLPCGNAKAALEGLEDGKTYTQEELEAIAKQQMGEGYQEYLAGKASIPELQNQIETEQQNYKEQQNKLNEKVRAGLITDKEYNQQSKELKKNTDDRIKKLEKEVDKQEDAVKDFEKEFEKIQKDINKQLEKQQKEAEKAAEAQRKAEEKAAKAQQKLEDKATKQNEKLQAAVAECQAMNASPEKRWECEEKARKKYGLSDEQQQALDEKQAREQAQKEAQEKAEQEKKEQQAADEYLKDLQGIEDNEDEEEEGEWDFPDQKDGKPQIPGVDVDESPDGSDPLSSSDGNATGSGLTGVCANAGNIFKQIACKVMMFLIDLRVLAYIISGFGMVMFAWAAIFNKISWKHFSQIAIGLFMLSMIGPFITYFTGYEDIEKNLEYGNYLGGKYNPIQGAAEVQCPDGATDCTPDTDIAGTITLPELEVTAPKKKWSIKDLKGSIQSGLNLIRSGYNAYQSAKQVVNDVKTEAQNIGNAIKNSGGGLDGILNAASQVAGAANRLSFDMKTGMNGIAMQVANAANAAQDLTATNEEREARQNIRVNGDESGNKTTNAVTEWLSASGDGGKALSKLNDATNMVGKAATATGKATTAGHEGQKIGGNGGFGEVVGGIFAAGTAVSEGMGIYADAQQQKAQQQTQAQTQSQTPAQQAQQQAQSSPTQTPAQQAQQQAQSSPTQSPAQQAQQQAQSSPTQSPAQQAQQQAQSQSSTSSQQPTQVASAVSDSAVGAVSSDVSSSAVSAGVVDPAASRTGTSSEPTSSSSDDDDDWGFAKIKRQEREKAEKEAQEKQQQQEQLEQQKQQEKEKALAQQKEFVNSLPTEEVETPDAQLEQMLANREAANNLPAEEPETTDAQIEQMVAAKNAEKDALKKRVDEGREARSQAINNMSEEQKKQISEVKSIVNDYIWPEQVNTTENATNQANVLMEVAGDKVKAACGGSSECVILAIGQAFGWKYPTNCFYAEDGSIICERY